MGSLFCFRFFISKYFFHHLHVGGYGLDAPEGGESEAAGEVEGAFPVFPGEDFFNGGEEYVAVDGRVDAEAEFHVGGAVSHAEAGAFFHGKEAAADAVVAAGHGREGIHVMFDGAGEFQGASVVVEQAAVFDAAGYDGDEFQGIHISSFVVRDVISMVYGIQKFPRPSGI